MVEIQKLEDVSMTPLCWPEGRARVEEKTRHYGWRPSFEGALRNLKDELERSSVSRYRLSIDKKDNAAALWFEEDGELKVLASDAWDCVAHNVKAIQLTLMRLRLIEEYGVYSAKAAREGAKYGSLVLMKSGAEMLALAAPEKTPGFLARFFGPKKAERQDLVPVEAAPSVVKFRSKDEAREALKAARQYGENSDIYRQAVTAYTNFEGE